MTDFCLGVYILKRSRNRSVAATFKQGASSLPVKVIKKKKKANTVSANAKHFLNTVMSFTLELPPFQFGLPLFTDLFFNGKPGLK